jgi:hypothetical protein
MNYTVIVQDDWSITHMYAYTYSILESCNPILVSVRKKWMK